jgi:hypothetical protein
MACGGGGGKVEVVVVCQAVLKGSLQRAVPSKRIFRCLSYEVIMRLCALGYGGRIPVVGEALVMCGCRFDLLCSLFLRAHGMHDRDRGGQTPHMRPLNSGQAAEVSRISEGEATQAEQYRGPEPHIHPDRILPSSTLPT